MAGEPFDRSLASLALSLATKAGASYAEAYLESTASQDYILKQGTLDGAYQGTSSGIRVRVIKNGYLYSLCTQRPTRDSVTKLFSKVDTFRDRGVQDLAAARPSKAKYEVKEKNEADAKAILSKLLEIDKEVAKVKEIKFRYAHAGYSRTESYFTNSEGSDIECILPSVSTFFSVVVASGTSTRQRMLQNGAVGGIEYIDKFEIPMHAVEDARNMLKVMKDGIDVHGKIDRVVISPEIAGIGVHESIGHPLEADRVLGREAAQAGTSYLNKNNLGMRIGSDVVNLYDDPTIPNSAGYYLYDDEGVMARKKVLVKKGIQTELLQNRETAKIFGVESNAAARSTSVSVEPLVRMSNSYLGSDKSNKFDDLIEEAKDGIYIKNFTEWNIDDTRSFSKYQGNEAYIIKNGRLGKPVRNFSLESKTLDFWGAVQMVDNQLEFTYGNCGKGEPMQGVPVLMGGPAALLVFK